MASNKCSRCDKPLKENTEGDMRYCQGHYLTSGSNLTRNVRPVRELKMDREEDVTPKPGDYIRLNSEEHAVVDRVLRRLKKNVYRVLDTYGEGYVVYRNPDDDTDLRNAWKIRS